MTLKELADIGREAALTVQMICDESCATNMLKGNASDEPARQAFAQAVRDAVLAELVTKPDSSPTFEAHGFTWNRHTPSDPMPCDGEALVEWLLMSEADGGPYSYMKAKAANVVWSVPVGWRYAEPTPPATKTVPLDINDIRATDEFKSQLGATIFAPNFWDTNIVRLGIVHVAYADLANSYLRRQHGSSEWKPCTKEISANQH